MLRGVLVLVVVELKVGRPGHHLSSLRVCLRGTRPAPAAAPTPCTHSNPASSSALVSCFPMNTSRDEARLAVFPRAVRHTLEQRVHALEHVAVVAPLDCEHALHTERILPPVVPPASQANRSPCRGPPRHPSTGSRSSPRRRARDGCGCGRARRPSHSASAAAAAVRVRVQVARVITAGSLLLFLAGSRCRYECESASAECAKGSGSITPCTPVQVKPADAEHEVEVHPRFFRALDEVGKVVDLVLTRASTDLSSASVTEVGLVHHEPVGEAPPAPGPH